MSIDYERDEAEIFMQRIDPRHIYGNRVLFEELYPNVFLVKDCYGQKYIRDFNSGMDMFILDSKQYQDRLNNDVEFFGRILGIQLGWFMRGAFIGQQDIADRIGISQSSISRYVSGALIPSFKIVYDIIRICGYELDDIFSFVRI